MCDPMLRQPRLGRCHTTSSTSHYDILPFYVKSWQCGFESSLKLIEIMSRPYVYRKCATFGRKFLSCECDINQILREQGLDSSHKKIAQKEDCESKQRCVAAGEPKIFIYELGQYFHTTILVICVALHENENEYDVRTCRKEPLKVYRIDG